MSTSSTPVTSDDVAGVGRVDRRALQALEAPAPAPIFAFGGTCPRPADRCSIATSWPGAMRAAADAADADAADVVE